jgi:phage protein U
MSRVTLDEAVLEKLLAAGEPVDLVDGEGQVIGRFTPEPREPDEPHVIGEK